jgi:hypothetical protein
MTGCKESRTKSVSNHYQDSDALLSHFLNTYFFQFKILFDLTVVFLNPPAQPTGFNDLCPWPRMINRLLSFSNTAWTFYVKEFIFSQPILKRDFF